MTVKVVIYKRALFNEELKNGIKILVDQVVLSFGSKQSKYCFDQ